MIVSDGYDTGEPERLGAEMRRLRRRCRQIIWLNPLIGWRDYSPQARGMQAALPYVDLFAPAHNLESLAALEPYSREDLIIGRSCDRHSRHHLHPESPGRTVRAGYGRAHCRGDGGEGRRQGGDPARRHHVRRLDRRWLRPRRGAQAAREALADGKPRLLSVQPPDALQDQGIPAGEERGGVRFAKNMCPSEGSMDIFIEPVLPRPQIVICGGSPVAVAIADLGRRIGFDSHRVRPGSRAGRLRRGRAPDRRITPCR